MAPPDHQEFVRRAVSGETLVGVEPAVARKFFTDTDREEIQTQIGESLLLQRLLVKAVFFLGLPTLLVGLVASVFALRWYSAIAVPLMISSFFIYGGNASAGRQTLRVIWSVLACWFLAYDLGDEYGLALTVWLIFLPLPFLFVRLTYWFSTVFLRSLSVRNEQAFSLLYGKAIFLKEGG